MASLYAIGDRVQSIDELGRWENGRVVSIGMIGEETNAYSVKFDGFGPEFNQVVGSEAIRLRLPPYQELIRSKYEANSILYEESDQFQVPTSCRDWRRTYIHTTL